MSVYFDRETEYFFYIVKSAINNTKIAPPADTIDWDKIIKISEKQDVFGLLAGAVPNEILPDKTKTELNNYEKSQIVHMISMNNELAKIEKELEALGIRFMLLKGARIREFYPKQMMRQMSDFDIMYDIENKDKLIQMMNGNGYTLTSDGGNSEDFWKEPFFTFEFHHDLFKDVYGFCPDFSFVWDRAKKSDDNPFKYEMTVEDIYLHSLAHMYKHFVFGGFGIRFIIDNYLIIKQFSNSFDEEYVSKRIDEMKLADFRNTIDNLSLSFFEGELNDEQAEFIKKRILDGLFGSHNANVEEIYNRYQAQSNSKSIVGFVLQRIFPSKKQMQSNYPKLKEKPYLLLFYYIKRFFDKSSKGVKKVFKEIKFITNRG